MEQVTDGIARVPVRTPTLPPATHTNTWVLGDGELLVVDPASPWEDQQLLLANELFAREDDGERVAALFLTHHHHDHVSGAVDLQARLRRRGRDVPIVAHARTAELVRRTITVDELWDEGDVHTVGGRTLRVWHTPGHAPGHLVLIDEASGFVVAGDMVAGVGTIAIDPDEGDLHDYLTHLERLQGLAPSALLPAHGPVLHHSVAVLSGYIAHRNMRTEQIREALTTHGQSTPDDLAPRIYPELDPHLYPLAARQILTHLQWLQAHGVAHQRQGTWRVE